MNSKTKIAKAKSLAQMTKDKPLIKKLEIEQKFLSNLPKASTGEMTDILDFATNFRTNNQPY